MPRSAAPSGAWRGRGLDSTRSSSRLPPGQQPHRVPPWPLFSRRSTARSQAKPASLHSGQRPPPSHGVPARSLESPRMAKRMLVDAAHPEETRVVVLNGHRLEEFDFETSTKKQIKGNIYLAKVTRVEPSLQAAFVEYGGNRHGFLAFGEIHPDYYRIPIADRQAVIDADRAAEAAADEREERHVEAGTGDTLEAAVIVEPPSAEPPSDDLPDHLAEAAPLDLIRGLESDPVAGETEPEAEPAADALESAPEDSLREVEPQESDIAEIASPYEPIPPAGDAFAEDDAVQSAAPGDEHDGLIEAPPADAMPGEGLEAHAEEPEAHAEMPTPTPIETVGGDEIDETSRRRARPYRHYKIQEVIK